MKSFCKALSLLVALSVISFTATVSSAAPIKMKISMGDPDSHINVRFVREVFQKMVEEESKGAIKVEIYSAGVLGSYRESIEGMQMGSMEAAQVNASTLSSFSPTFICIGLPYAFSDRETLFTAYDGPVGEKLFSTLPALGLMGAGILDNGFRSITNNRGPIRTPDDVKGLKIRTLESPIAIATWRALGANPTPISWGELYTALQQGTVDAQENAAVNMNEVKIHHVQKYYSLTKHQADLDLMIMRKSFFDGLSPEHQAIIQKAFAAYCQAQRDAFDQEEQETLATMVKEGLIVNDLTPEERKAFQAKVQPVYDQFKDEIGAELLDLVLSYSK